MRRQMVTTMYNKEAYLFQFNNLRGFEANKTVCIKWYGNIVYTCLKKLCRLQIINNGFMRPIKCFYR